MNTLHSNLAFALWAGFAILAGAEPTNNTSASISHRVEQRSGNGIFNGKVNPTLNQQVEAAIADLQAVLTSEEDTAQEVEALLQDIAVRTTKGDAARQSLRRLGAKAIPSLVKLLTDNSSAVRRQAIAIVGNIVSDAKEVVPHTEEWRASTGPSWTSKLKSVLLRSLNDVDGEVQLVTANVLLMVDPNAGPTIVARCLEEVTEPQKENMARLLFRYGHNSLVPTNTQQKIVESGYKE